MKKKTNNLLRFIKTRFIFMLLWKLINRIKLQKFYNVDFFKYAPKEQQIFLLLDANRFLNNKSLIWSIDKSPKTPDITEGRHFFADGEKLAEGGVLELLDQMIGIFNKNKIDLKYSQEFIYTTPHDYTVKINSIEYEIFSIKDLNNPKICGISTIHTMEMLNDIFIRHNLNERVYSLYCGTNECIFYIATPEIIKLLTDHHKEIPKEVSYWKKLL